MGGGCVGGGRRLAFFFVDDRQRGPMEERGPRAVSRRDFFLFGLGVPLGQRADLRQIGRGSKRHWDWQDAQSLAAVPADASGGKERRRSAAVVTAVVVDRERFRSAECTRRRFDFFFSGRQRGLDFEAGAARAPKSTAESHGPMARAAAFAHVGQPATSAVGGARWPTFGAEFPAAKRRRQPKPSRHRTPSPLQPSNTPISYSILPV